MYRYFATSRNPARLLPPPGPAPAAPAAPTRYTDAEHLARRAWSSARLRAAPLAEQVETLRHFPGLEPLYYRLARLVLERQCPAALARAASELWARTDRAHETTRRLRAQVPRLAAFLRP